MAFAHGESITVTRQGAPTGASDDLGNPIHSTSTFTVDGVGVSPLTAEESVELWGPENEGGFTLYLPYGTALQSTDLVSVRGFLGLQVQGDAAMNQWRSPYTGWEAGAVAIVRRAS
jgi:hypothetical protein